MTTRQNFGIVMPVVPVPGRKGWFQIEGVPKILGYPDLGAWLRDETRMAGSLFATTKSGGVVKNAKLVGIHDNEGVVTNDSRFNQKSTIAGDHPEFLNEPKFAIVKWTKGPAHLADLYLCGLIVNAPEADIYMYTAKNVYGASYGWQGLHLDWPRSKISLATSAKSQNETKKSTHLADRLAVDTSATGTPIERVPTKSAMKDSVGLSAHELKVFKMKMARKAASAERAVKKTLLAKAVKREIAKVEKGKNKGV